MRRIFGKNSGLESSSSWGTRMTWQRLLSARRVQRHTTSKQELEDLRAVVERDLQRNALDYDVANVVSETEAAELLKKAQEFKREVEAWIATHHPSLVP